MRGLGNFWQRILCRLPEITHPLIRSSMFETNLLAQVIHSMTVIWTFTTEFRIQEHGIFSLPVHSLKSLRFMTNSARKTSVSRVRLFQDIMAVIESLGLCEYLLLFLNLEDISSIIAPILGVNLEPRTLVQLGEKVI